MPSYTPEMRRRLESLDGPALEDHQLTRLNALLDEILPHNHFYATKLAAAPRPITSLDQLAQLPFTYKQELLDSQLRGDQTGNRTYEIDRYVHWHQTSGTRGRPLVVLDTARDWQWWIDCWQFVFDAAGLTASDRVMLAFSFGPFIGFWSAFDAAIDRGCLAIPGGGQNTLGRLELIRASRATVVLCTPSYALHMADIAATRQIDLAATTVRRIILAGEPGGSVPEIRDRIARLWGAEVFDHGGATEVGPWGCPDSKRRGLHVLECEFIAEFLAIDTGKPAAEGELSELVLTTLGRYGSPVIRHRTGDLVRPVWQHDCAARFVLLEGGILGRTDDMMIIRGVNIFPSAIEQILRSFPEVLEYRMTARRTESMDHLIIEVEDRLEQPQRIAEELRLRLGLKVEVQSVPAGTLPRFEGKGKRFIDER